MIDLIITDAAMNILKENTTHGFDLGGNYSHRSDGRWNIELEEDVFGRLMKVAFPNESASDIIIRIGSTQN